MLWPILSFKNKVSTDQYILPYVKLRFRARKGHVFFKLTTDQVLVFHWIVGLCQVYLFGRQLMLTQDSKLSEVSVLFFLLYK